VAQEREPGAEEEGERRGESRTGLQEGGVTGVEEEEGGVAASRRIEEGGVTRGWVVDWPWGASVMRP
jgi:hypothetical protein